jgi:hypothetical protein
MDENLGGDLTKRAHTNVLLRNKVVFSRCTPVAGYCEISYGSSVSSTADSFSFVLHTDETEIDEDVGENLGIKRGALLGLFLHQADFPPSCSGPNVPEASLESPPSNRVDQSTAPSSG